jgi:RNA polymerase sigma factor (sigma-70 family)
MELVKAIAADDQAAIETFVKKFRPRLVRFARRRGVRWPDCEDVAQEAVLAAVSQLQRGLFRGESSLSRWLDSILDGKIADYWRSEPPQSASLVPINREAEQEIEVADIQTLADPAPDPTLGLTVKQIVNRMPISQRWIFHWYLEGYTLDEISQRLGWSTSMVWRTLAEAKETLRKNLRAAEKSDEFHRQNK